MCGLRRFNTLLRFSGTRRLACGSERRINHRQAVSVRHRLHIGNAQNSPQLVVRHLHRAGALGGTRSGLRKRGRHCSVERDIAFHLLHDLVNVSVQHGNGSKPLEIAERLLAVLGSPAPFRIDGPQRDVCENDDGAAGGLCLEVCF
jgi:hypothetical protein